MIVAINPLRADRISDRFPNIVQDSLIVGMFFVIATVVFKETILTASAVSAVVVGFALQDTLGNAFAGLAIQVEKPFRVGNWIKVGDFEGKVSQVTWRATKLLHARGHLHRRSQQHHLEGIDHQLLGADPSGPHLWSRSARPTTSRRTW